VLAPARQRRAAAGQRGGRLVDPRAGQLRARSHQRVEPGQERAVVRLGLRRPGKSGQTVAQLREPLAVDGAERRQLERGRLPVVRRRFGGQPIEVVQPVAAHGGDASEQRLAPVKVASQLCHALPPARDELLAARGWPGDTLDPRRRGWAASAAPASAVDAVGSDVRSAGP
jgi:hypothetical protein